MSNMINIRRDVRDPFYRYKMPRLVSKIEGRGNGIKSVIDNAAEIGRALNRLPSYITKYFAFELGTLCIINDRDARYIVNGAHDAEKLQGILDGFINKFVLCQACENPETDLVVEKDGTVVRACKACGHRGPVDMTHRLVSFIEKNPPPTRRRVKNVAQAKTPEVESAIVEGIKEGEQSFNVELDAVHKQLSEMKSKLEKFTNEISIELTSKQRDIQELDHYFLQVRSIQQEVLRIIQKCIPERVHQLDQDISNLEVEIAQYQQNVSKLSESIATASKQASEVQLIERTVLDNLRIRELARRAKDIQIRIDSLGQRIGAFDKQNTIILFQRQQLKQSDLFGERSGLLGEIRQLHDQLLRFNRELDTDYPDVEKNYKKHYIKVKSTGIAIEDLDKYSKALDQAIMKYHSLKMDEINKIIREIWTNTYQGADIDTIEIRADHDVAGGARSYNYRVVMIKGDTELDMRGRSSAGQRVLASLIIRLALAETFGIHCGILALDEPTTNLDHDNIESLANSLAQYRLIVFYISFFRIIANRRMQNNFQLIIITHDEEFVQLLGHHECADYYWRVHKDEQQYSVIERRSIRSNAN